MSENDIDTLYLKSSDAFDKMISDMQLNLLKTNNKYNEIDTINRELRSKYPKILGAFEKEEYKELNADEIKTLIEIIDNNQLLKNIELEKMFILGNKEAFYYFNRIGIIKNEDATK